jgi:hypothetical protein
MYTILTETASKESQVLTDLAERLLLNETWGSC